MLALDRGTRSQPSSDLDAAIVTKDVSFISTLSPKLSPGGCRLRSCKSHRGGYSSLAAWASVAAIIMIIMMCIKQSGIKLSSKRRLSDADDGSSTNPSLTCREALASDEGSDDDTDTAMSTGTSADESRGGGSSTSSTEQSQMVEILSGRSQTGTSDDEATAPYYSPPRKRTRSDSYAPGPSGVSRLRGPSSRNPLEDAVAAQVLVEQMSMQGPASSPPRTSVGSPCLSFPWLRETEKAVKDLTGTTFPGESPKEDMVLTVTKTRRSGSTAGQEVMVIVSTVDADVFAKVASTYPGLIGPRLRFSTDDEGEGTSAASPFSGATSPAPLKEDAEGPTPSRAADDAEAPTPSRAADDAEAPTPAAAANDAEVPRPASPAANGAEAPRPASPAANGAEAPRPASPAANGAEAPRPASPAANGAEAPRPASPAANGAEAPRPASPAANGAEAPRPASPAANGAEAPRPASPAANGAEAPRPAPATEVAEVPRPAAPATKDVETPRSAPATEDVEAPRSAPATEDVEAPGPPPATEDVEAPGPPPATKDVEAPGPPPAIEHAGEGPSGSFEARESEDAGEGPSGVLGSSVLYLPGRQASHGPGTSSESAIKALLTARPKRSNSAAKEALRGLDTESHPFYRTPSTGGRKPRRPVLRDLSLLSSDGTKLHAPILLDLREKFTKPVLDEWDLDFLLSLAERLAANIYYFEETALPKLPCKLVAVLGRRYLLLDAFVTVLGVLGETTGDDWWRSLVEGMPTDFKLPIPRRRMTGRDLFTRDLLLDLGDAIDSLKRGMRPCSLDTVHIKQRLFCSGLAPPAFKSPTFDPWREDDKLFWSGLSTPKPR